MVEYRRILSIDGGGIKGVFPAALLADIEKTLPEPIHSYFDLIVGTSTGGIIALGLGLGFKASKILDFYEKYGPEIFKGNRVVLTVKQALWRKYSHEHLQRALEETFEDNLIGHAKTRLVIPSFNIDTGEVHIYKTAHHEKFERDYKTSVVEAALATASAPTYFPLFKNSLGFALVDGGVWANNPAGVAAVEAVGVLEWPRDQVKLLSIGCTEEVFDVGPRKRNRGTWWVFGPNTASVLMQAQSAGALGTAYSLIGHENVVRINQTVPRRRFALDSAKEIADLCALGMFRGRNESAKINHVFFQEPVEPFVPYKQV
jgi:patatin-like phospholipase/acyl hydrolase